MNGVLHFCAAQLTLEGGPWRCVFRAIKRGGEGEVFFYKGGEMEWSGRVREEGNV